MFTTIIIFVATLLVLVLSHEFGHFITAKKFGVKVLEFGFGIPPRIIGKKFGETIYSLNWLPIGGFVKLFGEDETDKKVLNDPRSFSTQHVFKRIAIVVAGVSMNLLLAIILFWIVLAAQGFKEKIPLLTPYNFIGANQINEETIFIGEIKDGSPAQQAGINRGERVVAFNDVKLKSANELIDLTKKHVGESVTLTLANEEDKERKVEIIPRVNPPEGQGALGVALGTVMMANLDYQTVPQKVFSGITRSYNFTVYSFDILGSLISSAFKQRDFTPVSDSVAGPVRITQMTGMILESKSPLIPYLNFVGLLSLNLAILNILPVPALDGGRFFFLLIEAIFRKKVKAEVEKLIHTIGMGLLIALILAITFSDIKRLFP